MHHRERPTDSAQDAAGFAGEAHGIQSALPEEGVPQDFPVHVAAYSSGDARPKLALVRAGDQLALPSVNGQAARWQHAACEEVVRELVDYCTRNFAAAAEADRDVTLLHCFAALMRDKAWFTPAQDRWVVRRTAQLLGWDVPSVFGPPRPTQD